MNYLIIFCIFISHTMTQIEVKSKLNLRISDIVTKI